MSLFKIEITKLKGSLLWIPLALLPILSIGYGTINYVANKEVLVREWASLWTQVFLFYGAFFYPFIIGIVTAFIWHNEHKRNGLQLLLTASYSYKKIIMTKMLVALSALTVIQIYFISLYFLVGSFMSFEQNPPFSLCFWMIIITLLSFVQVSFQSYLSLKIKNFSIPVLLSLIFGIITYLGCAQNKLVEVQYIFGAANLSLAMNNQFPDISLTLLEWMKLIGWAGLLICGFTYLQVRYLEKLTR